MTTSICEVFTLPPYVGKRDENLEKDLQDKFTLARKWLAERGHPEYQSPEPDRGREEPI